MNIYFNMYAHIHVCSHFFRHIFPFISDVDWESQGY